MAEQPLKNVRAKRAWDILGLGCTAVDEILFVPAYPAADAKVEVRERQKCCGGLTATALVAAARLGARCAYAGSLGRDAESIFVLETLRREGINLTHVVQRADAGPIRSVIVVDRSKQTRTIFYHAALAKGADLKQPSARVVRSAKVLLVDRFGIPGMVRAAKIVRAAGGAVVADFESFQVPGFEKLFGLSDHLIVSENFAQQYTGSQSLPQAVKRLWNPRRNVVVVTCGARGCWYLACQMKEPKLLPAFRVKAIDTTGCGDVFHGAYAAALARGESLIDRLRFAAAAAALKATQPGGQAGIPRRTEVERFLISRKARRPT